MFSFYKNRFRFLAASILVVLAGIVSLLVFGLKLDIQFKGGSILKYTYQGDVDTAKVQQIAEDSLKTDVTVQLTSDLATQKKSIVISVAGDQALSTDEQTNLRTALTGAFPEQKIEVSETNVVDPYIGKQTLFKGLLAVAVSSLLIVLYVWIRFRTISGPSAGVFSLFALLHDVVIAFFVFIFIGAPLNETVIAVVLSILGWSVNDTIVIFDRIRENAGLPTFKGLTLPELVDRSIHQVLSRSVTTSVCAFLAILVAYVFAVVYNIESIRSFALPMMIGILVGSYSSIFLATPFWAQWMSRKQQA